MRFPVSWFHSDLKEGNLWTSLQMTKSMKRPLKRTHLRPCTRLFHDKINRREIWVPKAATHSSAGLLRTWTHGQGSGGREAQGSLPWTHIPMHTLHILTVAELLLASSTVWLRQESINPPSCNKPHLFCFVFKQCAWRPLKMEAPEPYLGKMKSSSSLLFTVRYMDLLTSAPTSLLTLHR